MSHDLSQTEMSANELPDEMVGTREICKRLGISYPTFIRLNNAGKLPMQRIGRQWKISRRVLRQYMDGQLTNSGSTSRSE